MSFSSLLVIYLEQTLTLRHCVGPRLSSRAILAGLLAAAGVWSYVSAKLPLEQVHTLKHVLLISLIFQAWQQACELIVQCRF